MKISVIRDDGIPGKDLGFLFYYERSGKFFIEIPGDVDEWEAPMLLSSLVHRGITSVDAYCSELWVQQRIVPVDRQNLGHILRDNGLKEYNPYKLLMLGHGRCAQDDCYVRSLKAAELPDEIRERINRKVESVTPLSEQQLLIGFRDGSLQTVSRSFCVRQKARLLAYFQAVNTIAEVQVETGGNGITWGENLSIPAEAIYQQGKRLELTKHDLHQYITHEVLTTSEACSMIGCSRQYIDELVRKGKLHPIKSDRRSRLFWRREIADRINNA